MRIEGNTAFVAVRCPHERFAQPIVQGPHQQLTSISPQRAEVHQVDDAADANSRRDQQIAALFAANTELRAANTELRAASVKQLVVNEQQRAANEQQLEQLRAANEQQLEQLRAANKQFRDDLQDVQSAIKELAGKAAFAPPGPGGKTLVGLTSLLQAMLSQWVPEQSTAELLSAHTERDADGKVLDTSRADKVGNYRLNLPYLYKVPAFVAETLNLDVTIKADDTNLATVVTVSQQIVDFVEERNTRSHDGAIGDVAEFIEDAFQQSRFRGNECLRRIFLQALKASRLLSRDPQRTEITTFDIASIVITEEDVTATNNFDIARISRGGEKITAGTKAARAHLRWLANVGDEKAKAHARDLVGKVRGEQRAAEETFTLPTGFPSSVGKYFSVLSNNWSARKKFSRRETSPGSPLTVNVRLPPGRISYKIVGSDGIWRHDPTKPTEADGFGGLNNWLIVGGEPETARDGS